MNHVDFDGKKYFEFNKKITSKKEIVDHVNSLTSKFDRFCILIINTEEKIKLNEFNIGNNFVRTFSRSNGDMLEDDNGGKQIISLYCPSNYDHTELFKYIVGKEVSCVFVISKKPTKEQMQLFNYAKTRIRGKYNV